MFEFKNSSIFQIEQFRIFDNFWNQSIIAIWKMDNFPNCKFWKFYKLDIFETWIFFLIWKITKISKISKFLNFPFIRYSASFKIFPIFILPYNINFISYCSDSRKFGSSTSARSLIFKFEISVILKFYYSKFRPSPDLCISYMEVNYQ